MAIKTYTQKHWDQSVKHIIEFSSQYDQLYLLRLSRGLTAALLEMELQVPNFTFSFIVVAENSGISYNMTIIGRKDGEGRYTFNTVCREHKKV